MSAKRRSNLIAVPDGERQLSEGLLIEASVVARLLRIRLLAIDASLIVAPAHVKRAAPKADEPAAPLMPRTRAIGAGLAGAERAISEGAASLAASRATARRGRRPSGVSEARGCGPGE